MEILSFEVSEFDQVTIDYMKMLGYKEDDIVDVASWFTEDGQVMNIVVPPKK